jgi:hypothetical protein
MNTIATIATIGAIGTIGAISEIGTIGTIGKMATICIAQRHVGIAFAQSRTSQIT